MCVRAQKTAGRCIPLVGIFLLFSFPAVAQDVDADAEHFFETEIRPLLIEKCSSCHGEKLQMAGLDLTTREGFNAGAGGKPIFLPGAPESSPLVRVVHYEGKIKMPPTGKLPEAAILALSRWIEMGAPWPKTRDDVAHSSDNSTIRETLARTGSDHWSFQVVRDPRPPMVKNVDWVKTGIDAFILARLEREGLRPAPAADKLTILRRSKLGLQGLLPTEEEIERFLEDSGSRSYPDLVDHLLDSSHYGEHWGRRWLDVARYADSTGVDEDLPYEHAWRYRDYVIGAFNDDLPYDQFVREQVAGDLLPPPPGQEVNVRGIVATGFLALGPKALAQQDTVQKVYDVVDEQIDTTSKAFLGLTIACARCHDHKFDPILTTDYYSLAAIFASTRSYSNPKVDAGGLLVMPLVRKDIGERYFEEQRRIKSVKRAIKMVLELGAVDYQLRSLVPKISSFMLASRRIYEDGLTVEVAAREAGVEVEELHKWAEYLEPSDEPKEHLSEWYAAEPSKRRSVAKRYENLYANVAREGMEIKNSWFAKNIDKLISGEKTLKLQTVRREPFHSEVSKGPLEFSGEEREQLISEKFGNQLLSLRARLRRMETEALSQPPLACAVTEGQPVSQPVFIRGRHGNHGPIVPKQFPIVLAGHDQQPVEQGSGRRELAKFLTSKDNPLTARVMVNRIWTWHFGEGLVRTPNNFGRIGELPTHPELLDYLARRFMESGWSVKYMHRLILLSSTYQMSSLVSDTGWDTDPSNRLWSHFNRRRLTFEELRDNYLLLSGKLDATIGGKLEFVSSEVPTREALQYVNNRRVDPDLTMRRSVYMPLHRNKLPTLLNLFDFGDATTSNGKRSQTIVAPQALYLMNSNFSNERSNEFSRRLLLENDVPITENDLVERAYLAALSRYPDPEERERAIRYMDRFKREQTSGDDARVAAWKSFCKMLMASNEFHYID